MSLSATITNIQSELGNTKLLIVSKTRSKKEILEVIEAGATDIAESRLKEIQEKFDLNLFRLMEQKGVKLHYIGPLQSNKIPKVVRLCDVIQSVDSLRYAEKINYAAAELKKVMPIFLQLNLTGEEQKHGLIVGEDDHPRLRKMIDSIHHLKNLQLLGFMTIGKAGDEITTRKAFQKCKRMANEFGLPEVSMGMSEDYQIAVEEGSTMVRLGRRIFQEAAEASCAA